MEWQIQNIARVPAARSAHTASPWGDKMLILGGNGGRKCLDDLLSFDPAKQRWKTEATTGQKPSAREGHTATYDPHGDQLYVFGGVQDIDLTNELFVLDMKTLVWTQLETIGSKPCPRERHTATLSEDGRTLVVFGGQSDGDRRFLNDAYLLDLQALTWSVTDYAKAPIPRYGHSACTVRNEMIVYGGKTSYGGMNDTNILTLSKPPVWSKPRVDGIAPAARWGHRVVSVGDTMVLFGGWNGTWCFQDLFTLHCDAVANRWYWTRLPTIGALPRARANHSLVCLQNKSLIVFGGLDTATIMNDTFVLPIAGPEARTPLSSLIATADAPARGVYSLDDFDMLTTLGAGSFGRVKLARHKETRKLHAVKILSKSELIRLKQVDHVMSEKRVLIAMEHPFIVRCFGAFQDTRHLHLVMEYVMGGEFFTHLRKAGRLDENSARYYAAQVTLIFQYLHSQDIVYRDLKPENLLLDKEGMIKITDFGFAKLMVENKTYTLCGTPEYIAPEILLNKGHDKGVDWWTLGILIYEMIAGNAPFVDEDPLQIYQQILKGKLQFTKHFSPAAKDLLRRLLTADLSRRLGGLKDGVDGVKNHKWFEGMNWTALYNREIPAPIVPQLRSETDTSNFSPVHDEAHLGDPINPEIDPFKHF